MRRALRVGAGDHYAGYAIKRSGVMADTIPLKPQNCPPSRRNIVRHESGMLSVIAPESCPPWAGIRTTLITSQLPIDDWHAYIGDPTLADAILDRLVHSAHKIHFKARESMRKNADSDDDKPTSTRKKID